MRRGYGAAVMMVCAAFAGCGHPASVDGTPTPSKATETASPHPVTPPDAATAPTVATVATTTTNSGPSLTVASSLAPKLEAVVRALRARKGVFKLEDELAKVIPKFATDDGVGLPDEASVDVLEVRRGFLVMAFLRITSKEPAEPAGPCEDDRPPNTRIIYASSDAGQERLRLAGESWSNNLGLALEFFDGKHPTVVFPRVVPTVPVLEVRYDYEPRCYSAGSGKKVEIFHVGNGSRIGDPISLNTRATVTGHSHDERATISWLAGKAPGTAFLAITSVATDTIWPCTGDSTPASSAECRARYSCARSTRLFAVTADAAVEEPQVESLRRTEPALAKLPVDRSEHSDAACGRL